MSKEPVFSLTPSALISPKVGLYATQPQNDAGRITEPRVWVPKAMKAMKSPTAAAEPLEEPPGVWAGSWGLRVLPGWRLANSAVTVLPSSTPPAARMSATHAASARGRKPSQMGEP